MASSFRDLARLFNGVSLIANEFAKRSLPATTDDFQTLIKKTLLSATDLTGLTKGNLRQFPNSPPSANPTPHRADAASSSVVFFTDGNPSQSESTPTTTTTPPIINDDGVTYSPSDAYHRLASDANVCAAEEEKSEVVTSSETVNRGVSGEVAPLPPLRKRRPRERKVPATPFSRALGLVLFDFIYSSLLGYDSLLSLVWILMNRICYF